MNSSKQYLEQIDRIKLKLEEAKQIDKGLKVFGASSHKYVVGEPISTYQVKNFEQKYNVELPEDYKLFLTKIGNGGISGYYKSAAGPFYGIYPLGQDLEALSYQPLKDLQRKVSIYPNMTDEYWKELIAPIEDDKNDDLPEDEFDELYGDVFGGILPIGSQGCTYIHGILLNGKHKGKVIYLDQDRQKPKFTYEDNFLDWYERWLDEIISGELLQEKAPSFGYSMGGNPISILEKYSNSEDEIYQQKCLFGIFNKTELTERILDKLELEYPKTTEENSKLIVQILSKNNYEKAKPYLIELLDKNTGFVLKVVYFS